MADMMSVRQAAQQWRISERRVRIYCAEGRIPGVITEGRSYRIPTDAMKPADRRMLRGVEVPPSFETQFAHIDSLKDALSTHGYLTHQALSEVHEHQDFILEFIYDSNALSGNHLTLPETARVLSGMTVADKSLHDHFAAVGHRDAFLFMAQLIGEDRALTEQVVKDIHARMLPDRPETRGIYRNDMTPHRASPPPEKLSYHVQRILNEYHNTKRHPIENAAIFYLTFEAVHPFSEANDRTARILLNLILMHRGYPPINLRYADKQKYDRAIDAYYRSRDSDPFVQMVADAVESRLKHYYEHAHAAKNC